MEDYRSNRTDKDASSLRRISWGAILAGVVIALVIQLLLNMLGLSLGAGVVDPATEKNPLSGIGMGAGIWLAISSLIALFAGGWVAGRLAGMPQTIDGIIHGAVTWGLMTLLTFWLMGSAVGNVLSATTSVIGQGFSLAAQGVSELAPEAKQAAKQALQQQDTSFQSIKQEARQMLQQTDTQDLQPGELREEGQEAAQTAQQTAKDIAKTPGDAISDIDQSLDKMFSSLQQTAQEVDPEALASVIADRTNKSPEEAKNIANRWIQQSQKAVNQAQEAAKQAKQKAIQASDAMASAISSAALWASIAMILGAIAAAVGGMIGSPKHLPAAGVRH
ncbi:hypothetical protein [Halomonas sp. M20]|uniref:hypothetical protein n=1 Tax=Halomonas sp. M20 TaxID=2763264 RepID=UPI001D0AC4BE|nr:hypothetical protein [Halomonas sp. M20]